MSPCCHSLLPSHRSQLGVWTRAHEHFTAPNHPTICHNHHYLDPVSSLQLVPSTRHSTRPLSQHRVRQNESSSVHTQDAGTRIRVVFTHSLLNQLPNPWSRPNTLPSFPFERPLPHLHSRGHRYQIGAVIAHNCNIYLSTTTIYNRDI